MNELTRDAFCGLCGDELRAPDRSAQGGRAHSNAESAGDAHAECRRRLSLEPPRYCVHCHRRMKVQVTPLAWDAECARHGRTTG